jgi:hypothetical protein
MYALSQSGITDSSDVASSRAANDSWGGSSELSDDGEDSERRCELHIV